MNPSRYRLPQIRALSWGCGVQSTTLGEMAARGLLGPLDVIVTADTGWERQVTYQARDFYATRWRGMGLRVKTVSAGDIRKLGAEEHIHIPFWTETGGPLKRQCTGKFKVRPIRRHLRELVGYHASKPPSPPAGAIETWIGISLDEYSRARHPDVAFTVNRWPLLELKMTRGDCEDWLRSRSLPVPPKSACVCCPYRRASEWLAMKQEAPDEFQAAVEFDEANRDNPLAKRGKSTADSLYLWRGLEPLAEVDFEDIARRERQMYGVQIPFFCESGGACWV